MNGPPVIGRRGELVCTEPFPSMPLTFWGDGGDGSGRNELGRILMAVRASVANHAGVYLGTSGLAEAPDLHPVPNAMLQHLYGRLSDRVVYGGYWQECTRAIVRHKDLMT